MLALPNALQAAVCGSSVTPMLWCFPPLNTTRLGSAIPLHVSPRGTLLGCLPTFDTMCPCQDHVAIELRAELAVTGAPFRPACTLCPRDPEAIGPAALACLRTCLRNTLPVPWSLNIHAHTEYLYASVRLGCQFLPRTRRQHRAFVTPRTATFIEHSRLLQQLLRQLDRLVAKLDADCHCHSAEGWDAEAARHVRSLVAAVLKNNRRLVRLSVAQDKADYAAAPAGRHG